MDVFLNVLLCENKPDSLKQKVKLKFTWCLQTDMMTLLSEPPTDVTGGEEESPRHITPRFYRCIYVSFVDIQHIQMDSQTDHM